MGAKTKYGCFILLAMVLLMIAAGCSQKRVAPAPPEVITDFAGVHEDEIFRNSDGMHLFSQYWAPPGSPRAIVLQLHGTTFHGGVYEEMGKFLASYGYLAYATDLRGWGRSVDEKPKGFVATYDDYASDLSLIVQKLQNRYPGTDIYVMGESLGATVAMYSYLKADLPFKGMIFSGPGYRPNPEVLGIRFPRLFMWLPMYMGKQWGRVFPYWPMGPADIGIMMAIESPKTQERILDDPLVAHNWLPNAYLTELMKADDYNQEHLEEIDLPLLIVHGEDDMLIPVASSREIIERVSSTDKTLRVYPDTAHATLVEHSRYEVFKDIVRWLNQRTATAERN